MRCCEDTRWMGVSLNEVKQTQAVVATYTAKAGTHKNPRGKESPQRGAFHYHLKAILTTQTKQSESPSFTEGHHSAVSRPIELTLIQKGARETG